SPRPPSRASTCRSPRARAPRSARPHRPRSRHARSRGPDAARSYTARSRCRLRAAARSLPACCYLPPCIPLFAPDHDAMLSPCLAGGVSFDQANRAFALEQKGRTSMLRRLTVIVAIAAWIAAGGAAHAEANTVRVAKQFGVAYMQYMVMQELKLIEKHAKASGLDITTEWATFRSSDVMNDALISGSVDFVSLGIPGIITIWSKTKGTSVEGKGVSGLNVSPLMLMVRDPAIKSIKDFKDNHRIAL